MPGDPIIVAKGVVLDNGTEQLRERWFDDLWGRWLIGLAATVISFVWIIFRTSVGHEPQLPDRPLTKADVPLIEKKIKYLRKDAETAASDHRDQAAQFFMAQANELSAKVKELEGVSTPSALTDSASRHGVKVGDTVEISAVNPVVAAHHAVVTEVNDEQVKVRVGSETFAIRWENVDRIKTESK